MEQKRILELAEGEEWTPLHDTVNGLLHEEKQCRMDNNAAKGSEICLKIVSKKNADSFSWDWLGKGKTTRRSATGCICSSNAEDSPNKPS